MFRIWVPTFYILVSLTTKGNFNLMVTVLSLNLQRKNILILYFEQESIDGYLRSLVSLIWYSLTFISSKTIANPYKISNLYITRTIKDIETGKAINKVINKTLTLIKTYTSHNGYM